MYQVKKTQIFICNKKDFISSFIIKIYEMYNFLSHPRKTYTTFIKLLLLMILVEQAFNNCDMFKG